MILVIIVVIFRIQCCSQYFIKEILCFREYYLLQTVFFQFFVIKEDYYQ